MCEIITFLELMPLVLLSLGTVQNFRHEVQMVRHYR